MRLIVENFDPDTYEDTQLLEVLISNYQSFKIVSDTDDKEVIQTQEDFEDFLDSDWQDSGCEF